MAATELGKLLRSNPALQRDLDQIIEKRLRKQRLTHEWETCGHLRTIAELHEQIRRLEREQDRDRGWRLPKIGELFRRITGAARHGATTDGS